MEYRGLEQGGWNKQRDWHRVAVSDMEAIQRGREVPLWGDYLLLSRTTRRVGVLLAYDNGGISAGDMWPQSWCPVPDHMGAAQPSVPG